MRSTGSPTRAAGRTSLLAGLLLVMGSILLASDHDVVVSEVAYHPLGGGAEGEFIEIVNRGPVRVDLTGWALVEGVRFAFPAGTRLEPRQRMVVCADPDALSSLVRDGLRLGPWEGRLDNAGEVITLANPDRSILQRVHYLDGAAWPSEADGLGPTLEITDPWADPAAPRHWRASGPVGGTPAARNSVEGPASDPAGPRVVLNEILPPGTPGGGGIELFTPDLAGVDVGGWHLVDSRGGQTRIADGVVVPGLGHALLGAGSIPFSLDLAGVTYALVREDGETFVDGLNPSPPPEGATAPSYGRYPDGDDDGFLLTEATPGGPNVLDRPDAVVIHEVMFHPPYRTPDAGCEIDCSDADQWIELHNRSDAPVDMSGWSLTKAVELLIPAGASIPARGYLLLASSRERFLSDHPGAAPDLVVGDWDRDLAHDSDTINLRDPLGNLVDHVRYGDGGPINDEEPIDGEDDGTIRVSDWPPGAQGTGRSIELIHPALENRLGRAWVEGPPGGTPLAPNAGWSATPAPVVGSVRHDPPVPSPAAVVRVTCRISSVTPLETATVEWRDDGGGADGDAPLRDDGLSGDGEAGDGIFGAEIPARPAGTVVAFRVRAEASGAPDTLVPAAPPVPPYPDAEAPEFLYPVLDAAPPDNPSESYWIVVREADLRDLRRRPVESDVLLPATFLHVPFDHREPKIHHLVGLRYRGEHSRDDERKSFRVDFPPERPFDGIERLNLNAPSVDAEVLATDLIRRAGVPAPVVWTVNLWMDGEFDEAYVRKEAVDDHFLRRVFGNASDDGNLYRALDPGAPLPHEGDLEWLGPDLTEYVPYYSKRTNREEADWSDVEELCRIFDPGETPDDTEFADRIEAAIDVEEWLRYFALQSCLSNPDGSIHNRSGEDYFLYRVPADSSRLDAGRWLILPWDIEESFDEQDEGIFEELEVEAIRRLLLHPRFAPRYVCQVLDLATGAFSRREMRQRFSRIDFLYGFSAIDGLDSYITARIGYYHATIPTEITVGSGDAAGASIVALGETWSYLKGSGEPSGGSLDWTLEGFDDSAWLTGPTGIGYGDGDDATVLGDMEDGYTTVYLRRRFEVADPDVLGDLTLRVDYDDGFAAFLNGEEVARRGLGAAGSPIAYDDTASPHEAGTAESIEMGPASQWLVAGTNVIAIVAVNASRGSSDLTMRPSLSEGGGSGAGCGLRVYTPAAELGLVGRANACRARAVRIDGETWPVDPIDWSWSAVVPVPPGGRTVTIEALDESGLPLEVAEVEALRLSSGLRSVEGDLEGDVVWTADGDPYLLEDDVVVQRGASLRIEPGTQILARADASIIVRGTISAEGTAERPIRMRALRCDRPWGGIAFDDTGVGADDPLQVLRHCDIAFGDPPGGYAGCIAPVDSRLLVDGCRFADLTANALDGTDSWVEVRSSLFERIQEGVHCTNSTVIVSGCTFRGMVGDKDAIDFDGNGDGRSLIQGCLFLDGSDDGVDLGSTSVDIIDNVFINVQDKALSLEGNGPAGPPSISGNIIYDCGTAIALKNGVDIEDGHHNTIVGNQQGLSLFAKASASNGGHGTFDSTILWHNTDDVYLDGRSSLSLSWSTVSDELWPGEGNITLDPSIAGVAVHDFSLLPTSPCIGTGREGTDMGALPYTGPVTRFVRGDVDESGDVTLTDAVAALRILFSGRAPPACLDRVDADDDGDWSVTDPIVILLHLYSGGAAPAAPYPDPGIDTTPDDLVCP